MNIVAVDARALSQTGQGISRFLYETLRELEKFSNLRIILFSNRPIHPANTLPFETIIDDKWRKVPGTVWVMARLNSLAKKAGCDTIWGPSNILPLRVRGVFTVITIYDFVHRLIPESMALWNRSVSYLLFDSSMRRADRVISISQSTKQDGMKLLGLSDESIEVIYLGARKIYQPDRNKIGDRTAIDEDGGYLFAIGSIEPRKNIDGLLNCFEGIRKNVPGLSLRLTGAHSWGAATTLKRIGESDFCKLLGFLSDQELSDQCAGARAFIMPSHYEGFGLPLIEAVGLAPIIASDIPVFRELGQFIDGICFVDFTDPSRASARIADFLNSNPPCAEFKVGAESIFEWQETALRYAKVLSQGNALRLLNDH